MNRNPISIRHAFNFAWPVFQKRYSLFTAILLTLFGAWVALEIVVIGGQRFGILWWAAAHLAFLIFFAGLEAGFLKICLALSAGGEPAFADTFRYLVLGPKLLAGQLIYLLLVGLGLALLVVPGIYLGVRCALFGFSLVTGEAGLLRSFAHSAALTAGAQTSLLALVVSLLVLNLLGASLLGLGLFVTVPLSVLMLTAVYGQLNAR